MEQKEIKDSIVKATIQDILERSDTGIKEYGTTLDREDLSETDWLQYAYEEALDLDLYLKKK